MKVMWKKLREGKIRIMVSGIMLFMIVSLAGCGGESKDSGETKEEAVVETTGEVKEEEVSDTESEENGSEEAAEGDEWKESLSSVEAPTEFHYETVTTIEGTSISAKAWIKGEMARNEITDSVAGSYINIFDGTDTYILDSKTKTGTKMPASLTDVKESDVEGSKAEADVGVGDDYMTKDWDWDGMKYLGKETINGINTFVFQEKEEGYKIWVHEAYGVPMKMESIQEEGSFTMEVTNFEIGNVEDSMFEIPSDYEVVEMNF